MLTTHPPYCFYCKVITLTNLVFILMTIMFEYIIFSDSIYVTNIAVPDLECYTGQQSDGPRMRENEKYIKLQRKSEHCELTNYNTIIYMRHPTGKLRFTSRHKETHLKVAAHIFLNLLPPLKIMNASGGSSKFPKS